MYYIYICGFVSLHKHAKLESCFPEVVHAKQISGKLRLPQRRCPRCWLWCWWWWWWDVAKDKVGMQMYMKLTSNLENMINHIYLCQKLWFLAVVCVRQCLRENFGCFNPCLSKQAMFIHFLGSRKRYPVLFFGPRYLHVASSTTQVVSHLRIIPNGGNWAPGMMSMLWPPLYGLLVQIYGIGFEYLVPLGYIYIYVYIRIYTYI